MSDAIAGDYLVEHVREALATDERLAELDAHIAVRGNRIYVTGVVATEERRQAITAVVHARCPDYEVFNETTVMCYDDPPGMERLT